MDISENSFQKTYGQKKAWEFMWKDSDISVSVVYIAKRSNRGHIPSFS